MAGMFATDARSLQRAFRTAGKLAPKRTTWKELAGVRLEIDPRIGASVASTDLDTFRSERLQVEGATGADAAIIDPRAAAAALAGRKGKVWVQISPEGVRIADAVLKRIGEGDAAAYPNAPTDAPAHAWSIRLGVEAVEAIASVSTAASDDPARPVLTGVGLDTQTAGYVVFVATDSYRLHWAWLASSDAIIGRTRTLAPGIIAQLEPGTLSLDLDQPRARMAGADAEVYGLQVEGEYPNWRQLIPTASTPGRVYLSPGACDDLVNACADAWRLLQADYRSRRRAERSRRAKDAINYRPMRLQASEHGVRLTIDSEGLSFDREVVCTYHDLPDTLACNPRYLADAVAHVRSTGTTGACYLHVRDGLKPIVATPGPDLDIQASAGALVMPIRI